MDPEPEASSLVHLKGNKEKLRCFHPKLVGGFNMFYVTHLKNMLVMSTNHPFCMVEKE